MIESASSPSSRGTPSAPSHRGARTDRFRYVLHAPAPLVLPSVWDAGSARVVEQAGVDAVALSAAAVAWSLACSDAQPLRGRELVATCERVCGSVAIPVIVDLRGAPHAVQDLPAVVEPLAFAGVAGLTLPDARREGDHRRLLDAVGAAAGKGNVRLHVTTHVAAEGALRRTRSREVIARAHACVDAGADAILVTGLDWAEVVSVVRELPVPVCVDVGDGWAPPVHVLARAGVRCVTLGLGPLRAASGALHRITSEARARGSYDLMNRALASGGDVTFGLV